MLSNIASIFFTKRAVPGLVVSVGLLFVLSSTRLVHYAELTNRYPIYTMYYNFKGESEELGVAYFVAFAPIRDHVRQHQLWSPAEVVHFNDGGFSKYLIPFEIADEQRYLFIEEVPVGARFGVQTYEATICDEKFYPIRHGTMRLNEYARPWCVLELTLETSGETFNESAVGKTMCAVGGVYYGSNFEAASRLPFNLNFKDDKEGFSDQVNEDVRGAAYRANKPRVTVGLIDWYEETEDGMFTFQNYVEASYYDTETVKATFRTLHPEIQIKDGYIERVSD